MTMGGARVGRKLTLLNHRGRSVLAQLLLLLLLIPILRILKLFLFLFFGKRFLHSLFNVCEIGHGML